MALPQHFAVYLYSLLSLISWRCLGLNIPEPKGRYNAALSTAELVDDSRIDPYDPNRGNRSVMVSLFYPVPRNQCNQTCLVPYAPRLAANEFDMEAAAHGAPSNGTFENLRLDVCCSPSHNATQDAITYPLVLFSAGLLDSRLQYNAMAQKITQAGYAVVTLDSTYGSSIVEFPDGRSVAGLNVSFWCDEHVTDVCSPTPNIPPLLETNVQDARFILDQLGGPSGIKSLIPSATQGFDTEHVAYCGHSFGGATAVRASMEDKRVVGAINLDGDQFGNITDVLAPVLLFGRSDPVPHNRTDDSTWQETWDHALGWRRQIGLRDAQHWTFNDQPMLAKLAGWPVTESLKAWIGILDGQRSFAVISAYVIESLDFPLKGQNSSLFDGPSQSFPEVVVG
ncbi:hypothetical protein K491DRAFT_604721 [Lophiostoma macrostomum CBS 122681]|uniref:1-alkyl-2-acetylglycerophosphocholine esterase n=1 Tax=Lophiostoma macrostomum CBS 122681 TaxID=1314788 RepID=A0A6A6SY97_9PLEO|nr:hypothetical protein K491DRAFT_604721 [Lophiostoma macrostomum CBS 122681]